ncbi:MAG: hypothetical protein U0175_39565 [Caldilineaceae bacterium]
MAHFNQPIQAETIGGFLLQIREHGTPLRVDSETETYYVLTAAQLKALLATLPTQAKDKVDLDHLTTFSPQDFGLSEADIADYEARQQLRQRAVNVHKQRPLNADLKRRLDAISQQGKIASPAERTQLLHELEALMNENLQALLPNPQ